MSRHNAPTYLVCPEPVKMYRTDAGYGMSFTDGSKVDIKINNDSDMTLYGIFTLLVNKRLFTNTSIARHYMQRCIHTEGGDK